MKRWPSLVVLLLMLISIIAIVPVPSDGLRYAMRQGLGGVDASWWGEAINDNTGYSVKDAGDVNGDGFDDILVGAPYHTKNGTNTGMAYVIFGKASGWSMDNNLATANASFFGEVTTDNAGTTTAPAGDVNGDGFDDFLVGAPYNDLGGGSAGKVYLILGKPSGWSMNVNLSTVDASFYGEAVGDYAGISVAGAGDVNGDGFDDFLIGAYYNNWAGADAGKTYLILGKASGWTKNVNLLNADASFVGEAANDWSGYSVAGAGDVNGDGLDDILISGHHNNRAASNAGAAYVFFGRMSGWPQNASLGTANESFLGEGNTDFFGKSVSGVGDVNGDGYDDILIGAYVSDYAAIADRGQSYLFFGNATGWAMNVSCANANASFLGEAASDWSAWPGAGAGDVNGDGYDDLIIGASYNGYGGIGTRGQAYLILGKATGWAMRTSLATANASFLGEVAADYAGMWVSGAGDVNGDGNDDILVGAPYNDAAAIAAGQVYLIFPELNLRPSSITSVKAYNASDFATEITSADVNDTVHVELVGSDGNASKRDIAIVNVTTNLSSPIGIQIRLVETGVNTGNYRGNFTIRDRTVDDYRWLKATIGDTIYISSVQDPTKNTTLIVGKVQLFPLTDNKAATEDVLYTAHYWTPSALPLTWTFATSADWLAWDGVNHNVTGTPNNGDIGNCWVKVNISDGVSRSDEHNFTLTVTNTPPMILTANVLTVKQNAPYLVDYASSDDGNGTITWHLNTNAGSWLTMNTGSGVLSGTPAEADVDPHNVNISVDDGHSGWDYAEFTLTVENMNDPPAITTTDVTETNEDAPYSVNYEAADPDVGDTQTWSVMTNASAWLHMDPSTGILAGTPTNNEVGSWLVGVYITDSGGAQASHNFSLMVRNVDDLPVFTSTPITDAKALFKYTYDAKAEDVDVGDVITYSLSQKPDGMALDPVTGHIEWIPTVTQVGDHGVIVKAFDALGFAEQEFTITVKKPATYPPQATLLEPADKAEVSVLSPTLRWNVSDQDSTTVKSDVYLGTIKAKVEARDTSARLAVGIIDRVYTVSSSLVKGTTYYWTIVPNDGANTGTCGSGIWSFKISNTAIADNPPVITSKPGETAYVDEKYEYDIEATDADVGDELTFSLDEGPTGMRLNTANGVIGWTPEAGTDGPHPVTVRVSDGKMSVTQSFTITVKTRPPNNKPSILNLQNKTVNVGDSLSVQVSASDKDGDALAYSLDKAPSGMNISTKGLISWKPEKGQTGNHPVVVKVSDGKDFATLTFNVTVNPTGGGGGGGSGTSSTAAWPDMMMMWLLLLMIIIVVAVVVAVVVTRRKKPAREEPRRHSYDGEPRRHGSHYSRYDEQGNPIPQQAPGPAPYVEEQVEYELPRTQESGDGAGYEQPEPAPPVPEPPEEPVPEPEPAPEPMPEIPSDAPAEEPPVDVEGPSKDSLRELDALLGIAAGSKAAERSSKARPRTEEEPARPRTGHKARKESAKDRLKKILEEDEEQ